MALAVIAACLAAGAAAYLFASLAFETRGLSAPRPRRDLRLHERVVSLCEALGHTPVLLKVSKMGFSRQFLLSLQRALGRRGFSFTVQGSLAAGLALCVLGCCACVFVSSSALGVPVGAAACGAVAAVVVGRDERSLRDARVAQMPEVLRSLSSALGAGKSLPQAIEHVGTNIAEPMGAEFLQASFEIQGGCSVEEAVEALCARVSAPGISLLGTALQISQRTGSPLTDLFARTARMVSDTVALQRELQVKTSQVRLSARVVAALPLALCAMLVLLSPDYRAGVALQAGRTCLGLAVLLDAAALWLVRRMMARTLE